MISSFLKLLCFEKDILWRLKWCRRSVPFLIFDFDCLFHFTLISIEKIIRVYLPGPRVCMCVYMYVLKYKFDLDVHFDLNFNIYVCINLLISLLSRWVVRWLGR